VLEREGAELFHSIDAGNIRKPPGTHVTVRTTVMSCHDGKFSSVPILRKHPGNCSASISILDE
jgi:hypothetical protein